MEPDSNRAFTLVDLLVLLAMVGIGALLLVPAMARTKPNSKAIQCLNNLRRFTAAWGMYPGDNSDRVPNNYGAADTINAIQNGRLDNWANNIMTWGANPNSLYDQSNTNVPWLANGPLGSYLSHTISVFKCPADNYLSAAQVNAGFLSRNRSISMNAVFGRFSSGNDSTAQGLNWGFPQFVQYLRQSRVPKPDKTWLVLDEHPDSINDGLFINNLSSSSWLDIPGSLHNGGCGISFVDGHSEMRRWLSPASIYRVQYYSPNPRFFDPLGHSDFNWYLEHSGWVYASTGEGAFGY
jgi:prepilin-type processing-associated H-X9-DG protein